MHAKAVPYSEIKPLWEEIRDKLTDDSNTLPTTGTFAGIYDGDRLAGGFILKQWGDVCVEIHGGVHPDFWGQGVEILLTLGRAIFADTPALKIVVFIPEFNRLMIACMKKIGMKHEGVITGAFLKRMRLYNLHVYGISRSEAKGK